jgi:hypothetical protein
MWHRLRSIWGWGSRIVYLERQSATMKGEIMSLQDDAKSLKDTLDGIAADVAPLGAGIASLQANLAAALANSPPDPDLLKGALAEANDLKAKFDAMAGGFASAGSPVPTTSDPAPAPTSLDPNTGMPATDGAAPADKPADPPAS